MTGTPLPRPRRRCKMDGIVKRIALAVLLLTLLGLVACGDDGREATQTLPIGTWEVEDPEASARKLLPAHRRSTAGDPAAEKSETVFLQHFSHLFREIVVEFRPDGTALNRVKGSWDSGTWVRTGDDVIVTVQRWGDMSVFMEIPFGIEGDRLTYDRLYDVPIPLRRSSRWTSDGK